MRILTLILMDCSTRLIADDSELSFADSGDELQKGTTKSSRSRTLLDAMLPPEDTDVEAELSRYSTDSGWSGTAASRNSFGAVLGD
jgi:hypothetical protein